jgi:hypothetical protein
MGNFVTTQQTPELSGHASEATDLPVVRGRRLVTLYNEDMQPQLIHEEALDFGLSSLLTVAGSASSPTTFPPASRHAYVLVHGLSAFSTDLKVLETILMDNGSPVLYRPCGASGQPKNLAGRAQATSRWNVANIPGYPANRRSLVPGIF